MRYLLISLFCLLLLYSCSLPIGRGLLEQIPTNEYAVNNYFSDVKKDYVYKAKFKVLTQNFGGILIIKKITQNYHRVVFTTEFGNKLFDLEIKNDAFKVNYILDDLNKKFILNMLEHDFQTLLSQNNKVDHQFSNEIEYILQSDTDAHQNYYVFSKHTMELTKIVSASKNREKLIISFLVTDRGISTSINLYHKKFKTKMDLNYIGKLD